MRLLTASRAALAFECSYFLREDVPHVDSFPGQAAAEGTALHSMIEARLRDQDPAPFVEPLDADAAARVGRKFVAWEAWAKTERRIGWLPEVALAYHARSDSARQLTPKHHRDYSDVRVGEMCMSLDLVYFGEDADGTYACVDDWKSGADSAYATAQLGVGALAWSRLHGVDRARVRAVYVGEDGVRAEVAWLSGFDLDMIRGQVLRAIELPDPEPRPGAHCAGLYCPARHACPATVQALAEIAQATPADMARLVADAITTPVAAGAVHARLRVVKDAIRAIEDRVRAVVEEHGYAPTPTGKVLRLVTTTRETFSRGRLPKEHADRILHELREVGALAESTSSYVKECSK